MRKKYDGMFVAETHEDALNFVCERSADPAAMKRTINLINEQWEGAKAMLSRFAAATAGLKTETGELLSVEAISTATSNYVEPYGKWGPYADRYHVKSLIMALLRYEESWLTALVTDGDTQYCHDEPLYDFLVRNGFSDDDIADLSYSNAPVLADGDLSSLIIPEQWLEYHGDWMIPEPSQMESL